MEDEGADGLGKETGREGGNGASGASKRADNGETTDLEAALTGEVAGEDSGGAGVDGTEEETDDGERGDATGGTGNPPKQNLEESRPDSQGVHEGTLAGPARAQRRQGKAPHRDSAPETGCRVSDLRRISAALRDQETDGPAGDRDLRALVGEDEESAQQHDARAQRREDAGELLRLRGGGGCRRRRGRDDGLLVAVVAAGGGLGLVAVEGPEAEGGGAAREAEREEVEEAPAVAAERGDEGGGDEGRDGAADAVAAVHGPEHGGAVAQVRAEDVVDTDI